MAIGVWQGLGVADGSMFRLSGGLDIIGRCWCSHTLKVLAAYRSRRCCSSAPRLASVAGNGRLVDREGGGAWSGTSRVWEVCLWIDLPVSGLLGRMMI